jgi:hypothetical protein
MVCEKRGNHHSREKYVPDSSLATSLGYGTKHREEGHLGDFYIPPLPYVTARHAID